MRNHPYETTRKPWPRVQSVDPAAPNSFRYGRSTVSIFSFANGPLGEHRRHDTDGIRLEIAARVPVERIRV